MANGGEVVCSDIGKVQVTSAAESSKNHLELLRDAARSLPQKLLKDFLSNGVCARCIFRLFCLHDQICSRPSVGTQILSAILHESVEHEGDGANNGVRESKDLIDVECLQDLQEVCRVCLGILQFIYSDENGVLVKKNHASDFAAAIADFVKQEGHQTSSSSLEVSLPPTVVENEQALRLYITKKYRTEPWLTEKFPSVSVTMKDFLKLSVANPLEKLLDVKSNESSLRIRLTYTLSDGSAKSQPIHDNNGCYKRRKIDDTDILKNCTDLQKFEGHELTSNSLIECRDEETSSITFPLEKVNQCCSLVFQCCKTSIYVGGRYLKENDSIKFSYDCELAPSSYILCSTGLADKLIQSVSNTWSIGVQVTCSCSDVEFSRNVSQSRWIIDDERMGEASVEEIVGGNILPICQGDSYKFHAAGREDIDVRMLGSGRPFLVEIQNARKFPSDVLIKDIEMKINSLERKFVRVKNLKFLGSQGWELMREGEAEKQKQYAALVWISSHLEDDDLQKLSSLRDLQILQKTPVRVLHRRSPLAREKIIHWMRIERIAGSSQYFMLHLCTQAGTYIKEFVHGDLGRTHPSVGSILGCRAEILQLDVTDVKMDCFQD